MESELKFSRTTRMTVDDTQSMIDKEKEEKKKELESGNIMSKKKKETEDEQNKEDYK